jgi:hypothetical protein
MRLRQWHARVVSGSRRVIGIFLSVYDIRKYFFIDFFFADMALRVPVVNIIVTTVWHV